MSADHLKAVQQDPPGRPTISKLNRVHGQTGRSYPCSGTGGLQLTRQVSCLVRLIIIAAAVPFPRGVAVLARRVRPGRRRLDRCNPRQDQKKSQDPFHDFLNLPGKPPTTTHTELATANSERNRAGAWRSYLQRYSENTGNAQVASTGRGSVGEFHISRSPTLLGRAGGVPQRPPPRPFGAQRMPGPHRARPRWHDPERGATQRSQTVRFGLGGLR
jgi:hypothetical protein